jgi:hypothetical protein
MTARTRNPGTFSQAALWVSSSSCSWLILFEGFTQGNSTGIPRAMGRKRTTKAGIAAPIDSKTRRNTVIHRAAEAWKMAFQMLAAMAMPSQ